MVDMLKAGVGFFLLFLAIVLRVFVFTTDFLQNVFGMDINKAYETVNKLSVLDPILWVVVIGISILLIVWGLEIPD